jgi:hypothetical protein
MKVLSAGLSSQTPVTVYDKTKPYIAGRVFQKSIGGAQVLGPPLTGFINTFLDQGAAPIATTTTPNGRQFQIISITSGVVICALYNVDLTGQTAPTYVGRIQFLVPNNAATTHSLRFFDVWDGPNAGTVTGWQIYLGTVGTVLINGGLFVVNNVALSDFVPISPPTIGMALASNAKAVYFAQDPATIGAANTLTAMQGGALDRSSRRIYFNNNAAATTQIAVFDPSVTPTVASQTTTAATANASPTFTMTGHGFAANDPVVITANNPTGFLLSFPNLAPAVYFVRATNLTANTFELSLTAGGAAINATSVTSGTVFLRAYGISTSQWLNIRTGTLSGIAGVILLTNCHSIVTPTQALDPSIPNAVNGQVCLFLPTNSTNHLIRVSDITNGATTLPNMVAVNSLGTGIDYTTISPTFAIYSDVIGRIIIVSNTTQFYIKRWVNNSVETAFGALNTTWLENPLNPPYTFSGVTVIGLDIRNGWLFYTSSTTGQRGVIYADIRSDSLYGFSYITSPVLDTSAVDKASTIQTVEKLFDLTASMVFSYRTAATSGAAIFNSPTTGWTTLPTGADISSVAFNNFTQFRVDFTIVMGNVNTPSQIRELYLSYLAKGESSDNWIADNDNTTQGLASPSYASFYLAQAYPTTVPQLFARVLDTSNAVIASGNTLANAASFEYSTDGGTTWLPMGTIPNVVGTRVRFNVSPTPGGLAYATIRES